MTQENKIIRAKSVEISLPAKVTGIVFWGMVLVGVLVSTYLLNEKEQQLIDRYNIDVHHLEQELEEIYSYEKNHVMDHPYMSQKIQGLFSHISNIHSVEALTFEFAGHVYQYGEMNAQQEHRSGQVYIQSAIAGAHQLIEIDVYMQGLDNQIIHSRKDMLLIIGGLVFAFGMVLQKILQRVISKPILDMVVSAQKFTHENQMARFNEQRNDELGYLAKFVNEALDSSLQHQQELEASRKALIKEKIQAEITLHSIMDGVITTDENDIIVYLNPVAERLMGVTASQTKDLGLSSILHLVHEDNGERLSSPTLACLESKQVEVLENHAALMRNDGKVIPIEATIAPMRNDEGEVMGAVMVFQDVSQERKLNRQLSYQASHDVLTGLYNRHKFEEQVELALMNVDVEDRHHALCYIDLDQFKIVNDTCGHVAGDELLRQLSEILKCCIREGDILARLGGDEFGLLLENCSLKKATQVAEKLRQSVKDFRFIWDDKTFEIGASVGVVGINRGYMDLSAILASADMACYAAKDMGRNRVHVYEPSDEMLAERHGQMHWAGRITRALEENRMVLFEQPVVSIKDGVEAGNHCEVLLRMRDEDNDMIGPDAFIPAAERYNLMPTVDRWMISQVFKLLGRTSCTGVDKVVAINLSGTSLADEGLLGFVLNEAESLQVDLAHVCFEITETAAISNLSKATHFINGLRSKGCRFSLDDFGSGLSSFSYLKNLPVDYIKIDGSFVVDMLDDPIDRVMVEAIVEVGHVMGVQVIAEWVENEATLLLLKGMGVDYAQGYHLGRPKEVLIEEGII
jgi:diguanylate cyclase (GGDEF)-like protein/PAS domain S-box-containing protein